MNNLAVQTTDSARQAKSETHWTLSVLSTVFKNYTQLRTYERNRARISHHVLEQKILTKRKIEVKEVMRNMIIDNGLQSTVRNSYDALRAYRKQLLKLTRFLL